MNDIIIGGLKSKTVWLNVASVVLEITGVLATVAPPGTALITINLLNIVLRGFTNSSLADK